MTNKMWPRRALMSGMSAVAAAFALGARPASAQTAAGPFQPARDPQDEWLDKLRGKHRVVFDVTSSQGVPEALHFAVQHLHWEQEHVRRRRGRPRCGDCSQTLGDGVRLLRCHVGEGRQGPSRRPPVTPIRRAASRRGERSVQCDRDRSHRRNGQARLAVRRLGYGQPRPLAPDRGPQWRRRNYKELVASMIPSSHLMVAGVIGVTRAQEYGYSVVHVG